MKNILLFLLVLLSSCQPKGYYLKLSRGKELIEIDKVKYETAESKGNRGNEKEVENCFDFKKN